MKKTGSFFRYAPISAFCIITTACNFTNVKSEGSGLSQLDPGATVPSFAVVQAAVFRPYCISCHASDSSVGSLTNYASVYNLRGAIQDRVFITGTMPQGRALPVVAKSLLSVWLEAGAPEEGSNPIPAPSPSPGATPRPSPVPTTLLPTFRSLQSQVFRVSCMGCHSGSSGSSGISFSTLAQLKEEPHSILDMIVAGNPSTSRLVEAITNSSSSVSKMPPGSKVLTTTQISVIKQWIQAGSPP